MRAHRPTAEHPRPIAGPVAVLGATGRVGRALLGALDAHPEGPVAWRGLARGSDAPRERALAAGIDLTQICWAARDDRVALGEALAGCSAVVDLCAFDAADVAPVAEVLAEVSPGCARVVLASSMAAARERDGYGRGKRAAETAWQEASADAIALRIGHVIDPRATDGREAAWVQAWLRRGAPPALRGTGTQRLQLAPLAGLVSVLVDCLATPTPPRPRTVCPVTSPQILPARAIATALAAGAGLDPAQVTFDARGRDGPFGGGDELVDPSAAARLVGDELGAYAARWPDVQATLRSLGAAVASEGAAAGH